MDVKRAKDEARARMWELLLAARVSPSPGPRGGIPDFIGAEEAAQRLAAQEEWKRARVLMVNPDGAQRPVRCRALEEGKRVYMAVPKLAQVHPFVLLDPELLAAAPEVVGAKNGALRLGRPTQVAEMEPLDLVVAGSLAVSRRGVRLGKGAGYTDIELGLLMDAGRICASTPVATTVHDLQVVDEALPWGRFDVQVSLVVTPSAVIRVADPRPSPGIVWSKLEQSQIDEIPALVRA
jgi:5-formyltetrahydrofolate cyclo-ligase